jgi:P27 family predicted phage terminase small subunit
MARRRPSKNEKAPPLAPSQTEPSKPSKFSRRAAQIWDDIVDELRASGSLARTDSYLLAQYCVVLEQIEKTNIELARSYYLGRAGRKTLKPEVKLIEALEKRAIKIATILGLTPASRKTLQIKLRRGENAAKNPIADLT